MAGTGIRLVPRLVMNPDSAEAWEIQLHPGTNSIGRGDGNDIPIHHDSVSTSHCQIIVSDAGTRIKDLGSTNGTFIEEKPVKEALLLPGQTIHLGSVAVRFEFGPPPAPGSAVPPPPPPAPSEPNTASPAPVSASEFCKFHPRTLARLVCPKCGRSFCDLCVNTRREGGAIRKMCRTCGVECRPLALQPLRFAPQKPSFPRLVPGAFLYPLRGDGVILLVAGTLFFSLINAAKFIAQFGLIYGLAALLILVVFGTGYLTNYMRRILTSSAMGEDKMPDWPDLSDLSSDVISPFLQLLGTALACFIPAMLVAYFVDTDREWRSWALVAAYVFGCIYFPMAFLGVAMFDTIGAVNPLLVVPSIVRVLKEYLLMIVLFAVLLLARWLGGEVVLMHLSLPARIGYSVVSSFLGLYLLTVEMRLLGLMYLAKKEELGWFNR